MAGEGHGWDLEAGKLGEIVRETEPVLAGQALLLVSGSRLVESFAVVPPVTWSMS